MEIRSWLRLRSYEIYNIGGESITPFGKLVGMGYFIRPKFWNNGYTTEALQEVIRFAFEENEVFRISCGCIKDNIG